MENVMTNSVYFPSVSRVNSPFFNSVLNRVFDSFDNSLNTSSNGAANDTVNTISPNVDIYETEKNYQVLVDMPGVEKEAVNVEINEGILSISAERSLTEPENSKSSKKERYTGKYLRQFKVNETIDEEKIAASLNNGVLKLELPKKEEPEVVSKKITIQ